MTIWDSRNESDKKQKREIHHPCIAISEGYVEIGHSEEDFFLSIFWKVHFSMTLEQIYWEFSLFGPSCCFYAQFSSSELAKLWRCAIFWKYSALKVFHSTFLAKCFSGVQCFMYLAFLLHIRSHFMISKVAQTPRKSKLTKEILQYFIQVVQQMNTVLQLAAGNAIVSKNLPSNISSWVRDKQGFALHCIWRWTCPKCKSEPYWKKIDRSHFYYVRKNDSHSQADTTRKKKEYIWTRVQKYLLLIVQQYITLKSNKSF